MLRIETFVLLAISCVLDIRAAEFYNSSGFSAYTWTGLVLFTAIIRIYATTFHTAVYPLPSLSLYEGFLNFFSVVIIRVQIINMLAIVS